MTPNHERAAALDGADELDLAVDKEEAAGRRIRRVLRACPSLSVESAQRDALWLTVQAEICTTKPRVVRPFGSGASVLVTADHATDELLSAMDWLIAHDAEARELSPLRLFVMLRGVATRAKNGSGRKARADQLHGMTEVPARTRIAWQSLDDPGAA
jgi:hypothetical protein